MKKAIHPELPGSRRGYQLCKRLFDLAVSAVALLLLLPVMLILSLLIFLQDGGCPLYSQIRLGRSGKEIRIWKFRSMKADASFHALSPEEQAQYLAEFKLEPDPRVTGLGAFLRRSCLDELPQLWNILRGDMSFVGPRPILPEELDKYGAEEQALFLSVPPGLTGYWQACAGPDDTYTSGRRQQMELHYARSASFSFDVKLILSTLSAVRRKMRGR